MPKKAKIITYDPNIPVPPDFADAAGCVTYWRLATVDVHALENAWTLAANMLPKPVTQVVALRRAVLGFAEKRRLVRPLGQRSAWVIVDEVVIDDKTEYADKVRVRLDDTTGLVVESIGADAAETQDFAQRVKDAWAIEASKLDSTDVAYWLANLARVHQAVTLRDGGGVYFMPRHSLGSWTQVIEALQKASDCVVFSIPAVNASQDAVKAILDALVGEMDRETKELQDLLAMPPSERPGRYALQARSDNCMTLNDKVERYEQLLGVQLGDIRVKLDTLQAGLTAAILTIDAEKDAQQS
jgi:hypothetical protein